MAVVAGCAVAALALLVAAALQQGLRTALDQAGPREVTRVVVQPGDTLWSIATRVAPGADPRDVVAGIERASGLASAQVSAGQVVVVPAS